MDAKTFDRVVADAARRSTRRAALRLLVGSLAAGLLAQRGVAPARAAQRSDRDGDGLYDDDEVDVYGTNPDVFDTDRDGVGDGAEVYVGTNPRTASGGSACAVGFTDCFGVCVDLSTDNAHCGACGAACAEFVNCGSGQCGGVIPPPPPGCAAGLTDCAHTCVDLAANPYHCGVCGNVCPLESVCQDGYCTAPAVCPAGQTRCVYCTDLDDDLFNCGACGTACPTGWFCCGGTCVDISSHLYHCGGCNRACFAGDACENGVCA